MTRDSFTEWFVHLSAYWQLAIVGGWITALNIIQRPLIKRMWRVQERRMPQSEFIGVPPRTGLRIIARSQRSWLVWTGVEDMQQPYHKWTGTYIQLCDDGTAHSVTVQPDGTEDTMRIK